MKSDKRKIWFDIVEKAMLEPESKGIDRESVVITGSVAFLLMGFNVDPHDVDLLIYNTEEQMERITSFDKYKDLPLTDLHMTDHHSMVSYNYNVQKNESGQTDYEKFQFKIKETNYLTNEYYTDIDIILTSGLPDTNMKYGNIKISPIDEIITIKRGYRYKDGEYSRTKDIKLHELMKSQLNIVYLNP